MKDISYCKKINEWNLLVIVEDHGERLSDYEPFWKWKVQISNVENNVIKELSGPKNAYYEERIEAVEEAIENIYQLDTIEIDDSLLEKIEEELVKIK